MRHYTKTNHVLEMRQLVAPDTYDSWHMPCAEMYRPAQVMAQQGKLIEAIELAEKITIENYGHMCGHEFRCLTRTATVTLLAGPLGDARLTIRD